MRVRRFGVVLSADRIDQALAAGADYLEPTIAGGLVVRAPDGAWTLADAFSGRHYPSFAVFFPGDLRLSDPRAPLDPVWEYLDAVLPLVASVAEPGARIVFGSGAARTIPDDVDRAAAEERFAQVVRGTRNRAAAHVLTIVLEPLNRGETNLISTIAEAVAFLDRHGIDEVPIVADLFHITVEGEPLASVREHADRIGHVHLSDGDRRHVGAGGQPWRELLELLDAAGYPGNASLECTWGDDPEAEMRTSLGLLRSA